MPRAFIWMFALLAVLFFIARRFFRRSTTLTDYKIQQEERLKKMREENDQSSILLDEEALTPVLSALHDVPLPPQMTLNTTILRHGARVQVHDESHTLLDMALSYSRMSPMLGTERKFPHGAWHLRLDYRGKSGQDGVTAKTPELSEEYFDTLAAFATRVEDLIRSLHDRPF